MWFTTILRGHIFFILKVKWSFFMGHLTLEIEGTLFLWIIRKYSPSGSASYDRRRLLSFSAPKTYGFAREGVLNIYIEQEVDTSVSSTLCGLHYTDKFDPVK